MKPPSALLDFRHGKRSSIDYLEKHQLCDDLMVSLLLTAIIYLTNSTLTGELRRHGANVTFLLKQCDFLTALVVHVTGANLINWLAYDKNTHRMNIAFVD